MASTVKKSVWFVDTSQPVDILRQLSFQRSTSRFCDVVLRVCNEQFYAHSNVLAAASPYFGSFLGHGQDLPRAFSQKTPQIIEIHIDGSGGDLGYDEAVKRVIDYMYTSRIELSHIVITPIREIAKIMKMEKILDYCDKFLNGEDGTVTCKTENDKVSTSTQTESHDKQIKLIRVSADDLVGSIETKSKGNTKYKWIKNPNAEDQQDKETSDIQTSQMPRKRGRPRKILLTGFPDSLEKKDEQENSEKKNTQNEDMENDDEPGTHEESSDNQNESDRQPDPKDTEITTRSNRKRKLTIKMRALKLFRKDPVEDDNALKTSDMEGKVYECEYCPYTTEKSYHISRHQQAHANANRKYICEICHYTSDKLKAMIKHKREHYHAKNACALCDFQGDTFDSLKEHLIKHEDPCPFFCTVCELRFKTRTKLNLHMPKHSKEKPFVCKVCNAGFKWKHALKNHMITHSNSKDHLCDVCGFATAHKSQLKAHKLIHTGDTFKCTEPGCKFQATKRQNLKYHMLTHTHEKPHQCEYCGQAFSLVKNMKRHMLLHTNDRPYKCKQCVFSTTRYDKLKEHLLKQHGEGDSPKKRHRLSDYPKSLVPEERNIVFPCKVEEVSDSHMVATLQNLQVHVENQMSSGKGENSNEGQMITIHQPDQAFPITLTKIRPGNPITCEILTSLLQKPFLSVQNPLLPKADESSDGSLLQNQIEAVENSLNTQPHQLVENQAAEADGNRQIDMTSDTPQKPIPPIEKSMLQKPAESFEISLPQNQIEPIE